MATTASTVRLSISERMGQAFLQGKEKTAVNARVSSYMFIRQKRWALVLYTTRIADRADDSGNIHIQDGGFKTQTTGRWIGAVLPEGWRLSLGKDKDGGSTWRLRCGNSTPYIWDGTELHVHTDPILGQSLVSQQLKLDTKYLKAYDAGEDGPTDRYTVVDTGIYLRSDDTFAPSRHPYIAFNGSPTHPLGFSQYGEVEASVFPLRNWQGVGKRIPFESLPEHLQQHVLTRLGYIPSTLKTINLESAHAE